MQEETKNIFLA